MKQVVIVGGGFAGLNAAKGLAGAKEVQVTLVDRSNHHLFQPLLYQVAMAGLSPADIAAPIRSLLSGHHNVRVLQGEVTTIDLAAQTVTTDFGVLSYDYLILACGALFDFPILMIGLVKLGVVSTEVMAKARKAIIVVIFVVAAIVTPSPDPFSQLLLAIPLWVFFEVSLIICRRFEKPLQAVPQLDPPQV